MSWYRFKNFREKKTAIKKFKNEEFNKANLRNNFVSMKTNVFVEYLEFHFSLDGQSYRSYRRKLRVLSSLEEDVLRIAISRIKGIEKVYETKYVTFYVGAILATVAQVITAFGNVFTGFTIVISFIVMAFSMLTLKIFLKLMIKDKNFIAVLISFRELLEKTLDR
ncbi:hypothetical protein BSA171_13435 [Bacillus safensis]|uniref:hypothetical protein n=1 Tax=Bacillus safensis TaxID=561879 RepID=UPI00094BE0B1|nr:hypothetical protein [Bacillus safensis]APT49190.1 hypothetical protein BSA41_04280 [Bacillus safensis]APT54532.1 hypothetical protein BSA171_13435 [Bacillus safensis]